MSRNADVTFYSPTLGQQTVNVPAQSREGAEQVVRESYGSVQIISVNMNV
jgi:hypothetical protein|tara:strand:+ start:436 stop:585 length:150 start_codon:yes stop_codon:yes gene_type:complete